MRIRFTTLIVASLPLVSCDNATDFVTPGNAAEVGVDSFVAIGLGGLGGDFAAPSDINNGREVVGFFGVQSQAWIRGFLWSEAGEVRELGCLAGHTRCEPVSISETGVIVGYSWFPGPPRAVRWTREGEVIDLGGAVGEVSAALGVDRGGVVVGWRTDGDDARRSWIWSESTGVRDLPLPEGSTPHSIGPAGDVVGWLAGEVPILWRPEAGVMVLPGLVESGTGEALAVNARGWVVGDVAGPDGERVAALWATPDAVLDVLDGRAGAAMDVNAGGTVVGYFRETEDEQAFAEDQRAFLWSARAGVVELGAGYASAINDRGDVVGGSILGATIWLKGPTPRLAAFRLAPAASAAGAEWRHRWSTELEVLRRPALHAGGDRGR